MALAGAGINASEKAKKEKAKTEVYNKLKDKMNQFKKEIFNKFNEPLSSVTKFLNDYEESINLVNKLIPYLSEYVEKMNEIKKDISTKVSKMLVDRCISEAYIDRIYTNWHIAIIGLERSAKIDDKIHKNLSIAKDMIFYFPTQKDYEIWFREQTKQNSNKTPMSVYKPTVQETA